MGCWARSGRARHVPGCAGVPGSAGKRVTGQAGWLASLLACQPASFRFYLCACACMHLRVCVCVSCFRGCACVFFFFFFFFFFFRLCAVCLYVCARSRRLRCLHIGCVPGRPVFKPPEVPHGRGPSPRLDAGPNPRICGSLAQRAERVQPLWKSTHTHTQKKKKLAKHVMAIKAQKGHVC